VEGQGEAQPGRRAVGRDADVLDVEGVHHDEDAVGGNLPVRLAPSYP
jgi:hypothetical protein